MANNEIILILRSLTTGIALQLVYKLEQKLHAFCYSMNEMPLLPVSTSYWKGFLK